MVDYLGPVFVVVGIWAMQHFRLVHPTVATFRRTRREGTALARKTEYHSKAVLVVPVIWAQFISSGIGFTLLGATCLYYWLEGISIWNGENTTTLIGSVVRLIAFGFAFLLLLIQALGAYRLLGARPAYRTDATGERLRHPEFLRNDAGEWLDEQDQLIRYQDSTSEPIRLDDKGYALRYHRHGNVWWDAREDVPLVYQDGIPRQLNAAGHTLRYYQVNGQWKDATNGHTLAHPPTNAREIVQGQGVNLEETLNETDRRVRHELADMEQLDETATNRNRLGRFSISGSFTLMVVTGLVLGIAFVTIGVSLGHPYVIHMEDGREINIPFGFRLPIAFGMMSFMMACWALFAGTAVVAWGQNKAIKFMEFCITLAARQGALAAIGITAENVDQKVKPVDLADEERNSRILNSIPRFIFRNYILHVAHLFAFPNPLFAMMVTAIMFMRIFTDYRAAAEGFRTEIKIDRERYAWIQYTVFPWLVPLTILASIHEGTRSILFGQTFLLFEGIINILTGRTRLSIPGWETNAFLIAAGLAVGLAFWLIRVMVKVKKDEEGKWRKTGTLIFSIVTLTGPAIALACGSVGLILNAFDVTSIGLPKSPLVSYEGDPSAQGVSKEAVDDLTQSRTTPRHEWLQVQIERFYLDMPDWSQATLPITKEEESPPPTTEEDVDEAPVKATTKRTVRPIERQETKTQEEKEDDKTMAEFDAMVKRMK